MMFSGTAHLMYLLNLMFNFSNPKSIHCSVNTGYAVFCECSKFWNFMNIIKRFMNCTALCTIQYKLVLMPKGFIFQFFFKNAYISVEVFDVSYKIISDH